MIEKLPMDDESMDRMRSFFGPHQVDQMIRQAIQFCWMSLPAEKRTIGQVEGQIRRLVDRALENMKEDEGHFDFTDHA